MPAAGIGLLIIAHIADYTSFVVMVARHGLGAELNPIVATIASDWGLALLTVAKFATGGKKAFKAGEQGCKVP